MISTMCTTMLTSQGGAALAAFCVGSGGPASSSSCTAGASATIPGMPATGTGTGRRGSEPDDSRRSVVRLVQVVLVQIVQIVRLRHRHRQGPVGRYGNGLRDLAGRGGTRDRHRNRLRSGLGREWQRDRLKRRLRSAKWLSATHAASSTVPMLLCEFRARKGKRPFPGMFRYRPGEIFRPGMRARKCLP